MGTHKDLSSQYFPTNWQQFWRRRLLKNLALKHKVAIYPPFSPKKKKNGISFLLESRNAEEINVFRLKLSSSSPRGLQKRQKYDCALIFSQITNIFRCLPFGVLILMLGASAFPSITRNPCSLAKASDKPIKCHSGSLLRTARVAPPSATVSLHSERSWRIVVRQAESRANNNNVDWKCFCPS